MFAFTDIEEIKKVILKPKNKDFLKRGIEIKKQHQLHICGVGKDDFIEKLVGYENEKALELRKQNSFYFTVPIMANSLKPVDKIFSAKGTLKYFEFADNSAEQVFKDILKQEKVEDFIFQRWKNITFYDPNGLFYFEISKDGTRTYPTYKAVDSLYDIDFISQTEINYVIFQPEKIDANTIAYRVVDSRFDYQILRRNGDFSIDINNTIPNYFEKVPAFFTSNRIDKTNNYNFDTWISEGIILADSYFKDASIHEVYRIKQGMPYVWEVARACTVCKGAGVTEEGETCPSCLGSGIANDRRDVGDKIVINPSMSEKELRPVAGYIQPDLETWKQQEATLNNIELKINAAIWGSDSGDMVKTKSANTTAFEVSVTEQSKSDKLSIIAANLEICEKEIYKYYAKFHFPTKFKDVIIVYSQRYNLKTAEELFTHYINAKTNNVNSTMLDLIYEEYLNILYDKNKIELDRAYIKLYTKPFFHYTSQELLLMSVPKKDYYKNMYYDKFVIDFELKKPLYLSNITEVNAALELYINQLGVLNSDTEIMTSQSNFNSNTMQKKEQNEVQNK